MKDYFFKTPDRTVLSQLEIEMEGDYYQDENFIIDWIGKLPKTFDDEGHVTSWTENERFNVRVINPEYETTFDNLTGAVPVAPETPYRVFG